MSTLFGKPRNQVIKRPGALSRAAARAGHSTSEQAEIYSHSSDKKKRGEGNLAKAFATMRAKK